MSRKRSKPSVSHIPIQMRSSMKDDIGKALLYCQRHPVIVMLCACAVAAFVAICVNWRYYSEVAVRSFKLVYEYLGGIQIVIVPAIIFAVGFIAHALATRYVPSVVRFAGKPENRLAENALYGACATALALPLLLTFAAFSSPVSLRGDHISELDNAVKAERDKGEATRKELTAAESRNQALKVQVEQLTTENAALAKGAPVLTGPAARVAGIRKLLLEQADKIPSKEEFTKEKGGEWFGETQMLCGFIKLKDSDGRDFGQISWFESEYEGTYETMLRCAASVRAAAMNIKESDLPDE